MSSIEDFPPEVFEKIFSYLPILSVLEEVSLVCVKFHEVAASSKSLMRSVVLTWNKIQHNFDEAALLNSSRKYSNIRFTYCTGVTASLSKFIYNHASTISTLHFQDCTFTCDELRNLLTGVSDSLEALIFMETVILEVKDITKVELHKLHTLQVSRADEDQTAAWAVMSMISTESLQKFIYFGVDMIDQEQNEITVLDELLRSQLNLTELELPPLHSKPFVKRFLESPFTLYLRKLTLEPYNPAVITSDKRFFHDENLSKFLMTQKTTLRDLTLGNCVLDSKDLKLILSLNLRRTEFGSCKFIMEGDLNATNQSIKAFTLYQHGRRDAEDELAVCSFIKSCRGLEKVTFVYGTVTMQISLILSEYLTQLKKMQLRNCSIVAIPYPYIKEVAAFRCRRDEIVQLVLMNPQLRLIRAQEELREDEIFTRILQRFPEIEVVACDNCY